MLVEQINHSSLGALVQNSKEPLVCPEIRVFTVLFTQECPQLY